MLSRSVARVLHEHPRAYRLARGSYEALARHLPPRSIPGVPGRVHRADLMLTSSRDRAAIEHYLEAGRAAVELIGAAAPNLAETTPLDLGCGHGRVLRWLVQHVEPARITVTDLDPSAVDFCRSEFGVGGFVCTTDPSSLAGTTGHDLVWMGSVITHLDQPASAALLRVIRQITVPGASVLVTQHAPDRLEDFVAEMPWLARRASELHTQLADGGWAYVDYPHTGPGYGLTFATDDAMRDLGSEVGLEVIEVRRRAWLAQDVWFLRVSSD